MGEAAKIERSVWRRQQRSQARCGEARAAAGRSGSLCGEGNRGRRVCVEEEIEVAEGLCGGGSRGRRVCVEKAVEVAGSVGRRQ